MSSQPERIERVFLVIDPTRLVQPGFEKAEWVAARNDAELYLYCCIWDPDLDREDEETKRAIEETRRWIERIAASSREKGIKITVEVDWDADWRERIGEVARECEADLIVKTVNRHSRVRRQLMRTSDWTLLRNASCPTLLVDPRRPPNPRTLLAAVKLRPGDDTHTVLNEKVIGMAHRIADILDAELHAVTVYKGQDVYFDRQKFADSCGLPRNRVHSTDGTPHHGIAEVAEQVQADVLIVGCAANQAPERGVIIGDTAQRVIDEVDTDVIVVPAG